VLNPNPEDNIIENAQVLTTLTFWTDYGKKIYVIFIELCM